MKHLFTKLMVIVAMLFAGSALMTACTPDNGDDYNGPPVLEVGEPDVKSAINVVIPLNAKKLTSVGYKLVEIVEGQELTAPNARLIFLGGKKVDGNPKALKLTGNDGLVRGKKFIVYIAAAISESEFYNNGEVFSKEFETPDNYADDEVVVLSTTVSSEDISARVFITLPDKVKQEKRRVRWGVGNYAILAYRGNPPMARTLHMCDVSYPASLLANDTELVIDEQHAYERNADGSIRYTYFASYDEKTGKPILADVSEDDPKVDEGQATASEYYSPLKPGEPVVLMFSEVYYADCRLGDGDKTKDGETHYIATCDKKHPTTDWGWGEGWYYYPYDMNKYEYETGHQLPNMGVGGGGASSNVDTDKYWLEGAWYKRVEFRMPEPAKFDGNVKVEIKNLTTDSGEIYFTPDEKTDFYHWTIYPEADYMALVKTYLRNDPSLMQWLTTTETIGPYIAQVWTNKADGSTYKINLTNQNNGEEYFFYDLEQGSRYHILVNAVPGKMVDGRLAIDPSAQNFQHITFTVPSFKTEKPELVVTPYPSTLPDRVKFNIKNPNYSSNPVKRVVYAAEDARAFENYMDDNNLTYKQILQANDGVRDQNGNLLFNFSAGELAEINSEEGFDIEFAYLRPKTHFTLAVMGWNEEGNPSNPDAEDSKAVARAISTDELPVDALNMDRLNELKGDWTATATVMDYDYETGKHTEKTKSWKVTIGDLNENNTLTAENYTFLEKYGITKEQADADLAQLNKLSADYNASVLAQNRVLCLGWDTTGQRETSLATPFDLFLMSDYGTSIVDYLFQDFGPKWFLQTDADGNIFVPVNYSIIQPITQWYDGAGHYLCLGNYTSRLGFPYNPADLSDVQSVGIPVVISEDGNTVTLKSMKSGETPLYPTMMYDYNGQLAFHFFYINSEVVLTKGWNDTTTEPAPAPAPAKASSKSVGAVKKVANINNFKAPTKLGVRTKFAPVTEKKNKIVVSDVKYRTPEERLKRMDEYMSRRNMAVRK